MNFDVITFQSPLQHRLNFLKTFTAYIALIYEYRKVPKFSDAKLFCCNFSKVQIKRSFYRKNCAQSADGITNSVDPDQTAPIGAV